MGAGVVGARTACFGSHTTRGRAVLRRRGEGVAEEAGEQVRTEVRKQGRSRPARTICSARGCARPPRGRRSFAAHLVVERAAQLCHVVWQSTASRTRAGEGGDAATVCIKYGDWRSAHAFGQAAGAHRVLHAARVYQVAVQRCGDGRVFILHNYLFCNSLCTIIGNSSLWTRENAIYNENDRRALRPYPAGRRVLPGSLYVPSPHQKAIN
jgi:hypothetical protein